MPNLITIDQKLCVITQTYAQSELYIDTITCVRVGNDVSQWFPVNVGLRQGCVMSPWLCKVYMDGVVREVNVRELGKGLEWQV